VIVCRSQAELETMRAAGKLVGQVLSALAKAVAPGVTTADLDALAEGIILDAGAVPAFKGYHGYPATICASVNDVIVHGIPNRNKLQEGDIIGLDFGSIFEGFVGDGAITVGVGRVSERAELLMKTTKECLDLSI